MPDTRSLITYSDDLTIAIQENNVEEVDAKQESSLKSWQCITSEWS